MENCIKHEKITPKDIKYKMYDWKQKPNITFGKAFEKFPWLLIFMANFHGWERLIRGAGKYIYASTQP